MTNLRQQKVSAIVMTAETFSIAHTVRILLQTLPLM
jgi:hypothetical protein